MERLNDTPGFLCSDYAFNAKSLDDTSNAKSPSNLTVFLRVILCRRQSLGQMQRLVIGAAAHRRLSPTLGQAPHTALALSTLNSQQLQMAIRLPLKAMEEAQAFQVSPSKNSSSASKKLQSYELGSLDHSCRPDR